METAYQNKRKKNLSGDTGPLQTDYLVVFIAGQRFGIPVLQIQDVLGEQEVTAVPLAAKEVSGALNLRGRIVTAINVRQRLSLPAPEADQVSRSMSVVVELDHELYSLIIDKVGDVISLYNSDFESNPPTLDATWREVSTGIYRLEEDLLVILDVSRLLKSVH